MPQHPAGTFEPQIARKRQRRLNGVNEDGTNYGGDVTAGAAWNLAAHS